MKSYGTPDIFGAKGDGVTNDTAAINACLAEHDNVYIPNGVYMIDATVSVKPRSGQTILMADNAVLKIIPNGARYNDAIKIQNVTDVTIKGGKICGDRHDHTPQPPDANGNPVSDEFGYGIGIYNAQRITIDGCEIYDHWGDAICIISRNLTDDYETDASRDIVVKNSVLHDCRRQGISVVGSIGFIAENVEIFNIGGTAPGAGIDFEADVTGSYNAGCVLKNVTIRDCVKGISGNGQSKDLTINSCDIENYTVLRQSEYVNVSNSKIDYMALCGNTNTVRYSEVKHLFIGSKTKRVSVEHCSLCSEYLADDEEKSRLVHYSTDSVGTTTDDEGVIDFDHCTFHTFESGAYSADYRAFLMSRFPKRFSIKNSTLYINNPNGMMLRATDGIDLIDNTFVVNYNAEGISGVFITFDGDGNIAGNTFDRIDSSAVTNSASLFTASGQDVTFINNRCLGDMAIGPRIFYHNTAATGSIKAINNVFPQYANLGMIAEGVAVTEIGNVYSTTT